MPRPFKFRRVAGLPVANFFKPAGLPKRTLEQVNLTVDEFEAIRLADLKGLYQEDAAKSMGVSRQTFGNILRSAHNKIADCLINSKALRIAGGVIEKIDRAFICYDCRNQWSMPYETSIPNECPECHEENIQMVEQFQGWGHGRHRGGRGRGRGRRGRM